MQTYVSQSFAFVKSIMAEITTNETEMLVDGTDGDISGKLTSAQVCCITMTSMCRDGLCSLLSIVYVNGSVLHLF